MGAAEQRRLANEYETIYILRPNASTEESEKVSQRIAEVVERLEGKITKVDNWGKRRLAYEIKKFTRGIFVYVRYVGYNDLVGEIERNLRMLDPVMRYQTIVLDKLFDMEEVEVDPEEVKFLPIEVTEDEEEPSYEQQLGLSPRAPRRAEEEGASEDAAEGGEEESAEAKAEGGEGEGAAAEAEGGEKDTAEEEPAAKEEPASEGEEKKTASASDEEK